MRFRSNSARAPNRWKVSCPVAEEVSICSVMLLKANALPRKRVDEFDQMRERPGQPVKPPDNEGIPWPKAGEGVLQARALYYKATSVYTY